MQNSVVRSVLAVVLSIAAAVVSFMMIEGISAVLHPWPDDFGGTIEEIEQQVKTYPAWVLALLGGVGYGATMFGCTYLATRLGHNRSPWYGYAVAALLFLMVLLNLLMLPYPAWYWVLMLLVLPTAGYFGTQCAAGTRDFPVDPAAV